MMVYYETQGGGSVNTELVKKRMDDLGVKQDYLADKLKMAQSTLSLKLNNSRKLEISEMFKIQEILKIKDSELRIFFVS